MLSTKGPLAKAKLLLGLGVLIAGFYATHSLVLLGSERSEVGFDDVLFLLPRLLLLLAAFAVHFSAEASIAVIFIAILISGVASLLRSYALAFPVLIFCCFICLRFFSTSSYCSGLNL